MIKCYLTYKKKLNWRLYEPASNEEIIKIEAELNIKLPNEYKKLLTITNGFSTDESITIFGTNDILERNKTYEVEEYAKGYIAIGNNGGDDFLLMKANENAKEVISVDCGVIDPKYSHPFADDLIKWVDEGAIDPENLED